MENSPFPKQSDLTGSTSLQGVEPSGMGQSGLGSTGAGSVMGSSGLGASGLAGSTGTNLGSGTMGTGRSTSEQARQAVDRASATAHQTVDRLASGASRLANQLDEKTRRFTDAPMRALDYSKHSVQDNPLQSVVVAMALGFLIGRLTAHSGRRDADL